MRRLILMRHAKAGRAGPGGEDFDRPLAPQGRTDAALMGRVLAGEGLVPDRVLVSAALRTRETWEELSASLPGAEAGISRDLYLADGMALRFAIDDADDADTLLVIAHNPGIHMLAYALLLEGSAPPSLLAKLEHGFPTATAIVFAIDEAGRPIYDGLLLAAEHGGGGGE